ncbi:exocyst complex component Sec3 protein [Rutstroemia sp. NJR-2017a BBW]|nr:exocyst complex component Sec3 protein [Rutstroemia sp. NJR-2017a BBW]
MDGSSRNGSGGVNSSNGMSRAERFDDEKRRIVDSCFGKTDPDGSLLESYITHIRIIEDASSPSSPAPPNSNPDAKKPRLIIVAVRKSGRVRMHKARENGNGSFSIGKTWMLDDLSAIESFSGAVPTTPEEEQRKQWAGGTGFIVTIGKPYYWQANTQKEKQFFIASLVKIYTKYTGGKAPTLIGFDAKEREQLSVPHDHNSLRLSNLPRACSSRNRFRPQGTRHSNRINLDLSSGNHRGNLCCANSRVEMLCYVAPVRLQLAQGQTFRQMEAQHINQVQIQHFRHRSQILDHRLGLGLSAEPGGVMPQSSQSSLRRLEGSNHSQESFARSDDGGGAPPRSRGGYNGLPNAPGRFPDRSVTPSSQRVSPDPSFASSQKDLSMDTPPLPAPLAIPPERRRPPMPIRGMSSTDNIIPAPLASPGMRRDEMRPPTRSSERSIPREREMNGDGSIDTKLSETPVPMPVLEPIPPVLEITPKSEPVKVEVPVQTPSISAANSPVASPTSPKSPEIGDEPARPGLGPMIKKKSKGDIANTFLRAAKNAGGFKPRVGGAAERLREAALAAKTSDGPDGITGVVPAPSLLRRTSNDVTNPSSAAPSPAVSPPPVEALPPKAPARSATVDSIPEVKITVPEKDQPTTADGPAKGPQDGATLEKPKAREARRPKPASETMQKELASLGIDPSFLDGRGSDLVNAWDDFGWVGEGVHSKSIDMLKDDIERELNKVQAGGWLNRLDEEDERVEGIKNGLDKCMEECDELDGLLTLYLVELGTLNEDIAYIEAQSQGLQVQTANQKLLQAELQSLLDTISISSSQLESLQTASLERPRDLEQVEKALVVLFKAMVTIDPSLSISGPRPSEDGSLRSGKVGGFGNSEIGSMRVLQEKKDVYRATSVEFLQRLHAFLQMKFRAAIDETRKALDREKGGNLTRAAGKGKLDPRHHDLARNVLWRYSPLMLFAREVAHVEWERFLQDYELACKPLYQEEFREAVFAWKRVARKPHGDESDILFTSQIEKPTEGLATTAARKLTVKRSQTLARVRSPVSDNASKGRSDIADGRLQFHEVFAGALDEMIPIMSMEQNFIVEFFHVTSLEQHDFPDAVAAAPPDMRRGGDLRRPKVMDPNRSLAKRVIQTMEEVYAFFLGDMQALVDWTIQSDPLQGVGVLASIERKLVDLEESNQEYLARTLQKLHARLLTSFNKFLDEQIRAIEDTKVKIKKRKGVIGFIRIFPSFSLALETMLGGADDLEVRQIVNNAYARLNKTMFESLKVIARENPGAQTAGADPEDKEALNYQILLIENMNHYLEEVDSRSNPVLEEWKENATQEMDEHMSLYLGAVIRRPLGKLLDFLESTESLMLSRQPGESTSRIAAMPSHSKITFKKILAGYDVKEIRKGIETLKKRVEKHFGDADDPNLSRELVLKVNAQCERYYERVEERLLKIGGDIYDGEVVLEWTRPDVAAAFRK